MQTGKAGLELIKSFEGLGLKAYLCPSGVLTIGYGHTGMVRGSKITPQTTITPEEAEALLKEDLKHYEKAVNSLVKVPLNSNQFDALVSFVFNIGINAFSTSTLLTLLNNGDYKGASQQFKRWIYVGGKKVLEGLKNRRTAEEKLFNTPVLKALESPNDIIWELMNGSLKIEIQDVNKAVSDLEKAKKENSSVYWILYKIINKQRT
ncbi:MAG: lysozyme [Clostridia bacterium]|nr:lysozyme [Clostridia bacterium]